MHNIEKITRSSQRANIGRAYKIILSGRRCNVARRILYSITHGVARQLLNVMVISNIINSHGDTVMKTWRRLGFFYNVTILRDKNNEAVLEQYHLA